MKPIALNWTKQSVHARAEVYAVLANVATIAELPKWKLEKLLDDARSNSLQLSRENLKTVHSWSYRLINEFLNRGEVDVSEFQKNLAQPVKIKSSGKAPWNLKGKGI